MGYYVEMSVNVTIPANNILLAMEALRTLAGVSWTDKDKILECRDLIDMFQEFRYEAELIKDGDMSVHYFHGDKLGEDEQVWTVLAPYATDGSYITCRGEDNNYWKWKVVNGKLKDIPGHVVYDE